MLTFTPTCRALNQPGEDHGPFRLARAPKETSLPVQGRPLVDCPLVLQIDLGCSASKKVSPSRKGMPSMLGGSNTTEVEESCMVLDPQKSVNMPSAWDGNLFMDHSSNRSQRPCSHANGPIRNE